MLKNIPFHPIITGWFKSQFKTVSPPQEQGWPEIAKSKHTLIFAPTGSGKTLAAFLWCIDDLFRMGINTDDKIFDQNPFGVHTLYISPLKALNNDIFRNLEQPLKGISQLARKSSLAPPNIRSLVRTGDTPTHVRQSMVKKPPHILITTPESLYLLLTSERGREIFRQLKYLIIDEIHAIINNKRGVHLSLSVERLMNLCKAEPVRIGLSATQKPLERIAQFLGGQIDSKWRKVSIIDCGLKKDMDIKVISPTPDFSDLPASSVWPALYSQLYKLITSHKTTLVFANMRAQSEKIARQLNKIHQQKFGKKEEIAFAHHGSMSREIRFDIEERLKNGKIPAVIATASLELGIDIGSIDLVVNLEAPRSVSAALQRVGRSGHLLHGKSKGRIIPLYPSDLDDALALSQAMIKGQIEESTIPENCLDVLAQQIVAEVSTQNWQRLELYKLVCQSYCYRHLSESAFNHVIEMLSGRFSDSSLPSLQPRLTWDKVNDVLIPRKGSRITAIMNSGTIPDRGYYAVYLAGNNVRLGEMEEEFVFESRIGDVFFLGNNEWRIDAIKQDRIVVSPMTVVKPRAPFWKGETPYRGYEVSNIIGKFREQYSDKNLSGELIQWLQKEFPADQAILKNVIKYFEKQKKSTGLLPTTKNIIFEVFRDSADELNLVVHAPFGSRINAPWVMAFSAALEKRINCQVQYSFDDDGFLIRLLDTIEEIPINFLQNISVIEIEKLVIDSLASSPLFAIQFRYNAARALLLPRSQINKRIPLWLQRLRSADLLQAVKKYPDFPIIAETYRTCLQDIFDLQRLLSTIKKIQQRKIKVSIVNTPYPSPMASGLIFNFLSNQVYEYDRTRAPGDAASISSELLADILKRESIPAIVTKKIVKNAEQNWQYLSDNRKAKSAEDLFEIIEKLGPITINEIERRCLNNPADWIQQLKKKNRILELSGNYIGWISQTKKPLFSEKIDESEALILIRYYLESRGPRTLKDIQNNLTLSPDLIKKNLIVLTETNELVFGALIKDSKKKYWCNRNNFSILYRMAVAFRRKSVVSVNRNNYYKFLLHWHGFKNSLLSVKDIIDKYCGFGFAENVFEREIIRSRFSQSQETILNPYKEFNELISRGEIIVSCIKNGKREYVYLPRGQGNMFCNNGDIQFDENNQPVYRFLKENGASYFDDLVNGTGLSSTQVQDSLQTLINSGLVSGDNYSSIKSILLSQKAQQNKTYNRKPAASYSSYSRHGRPNRSFIKSKVSDKLKLKAGRWFLMESFAVQGKQLSSQQKTEKQTRLLLERHGILVKEWYRREKGFLPWYQIFQTLKRLEWQGEIRRGYFIEGLSGVQFALPEAVEFFENIDLETKDTESVNLISTIDPALPFGGNVPWNVLDLRKEKISITRSAANHLLFYEDEPVLYCENFAARIWTLSAFQQSKIEKTINSLKNWMRLSTDLRPRKRIEIELIDDKSACLSELTNNFIKHGFEKEGEKLVLWPSGV